MKTLCLLSAVVLLHLPSAYSEEIPPFLEEGKQYAVTFDQGSGWTTYTLIKKAQGDWWYVRSASVSAPWTGWINLATVTKIEHKPNPATNSSPFTRPLPPQ